mgnify:CR=1 FL=1
MLMAPLFSMTASAVVPLSSCIPIMPVSVVPDVPRLIVPLLTSRAFYPFHRNSVITANIHGAVILRNVIAVSEFHCNAAVFIKIDDPIALVPEEGIAAPGIAALTAKDFAVTSAIPPLIKRPFPPQKFSTPLWEELDSNIFPVL